MFDSHDADLTTPEARDANGLTSLRAAIEQSIALGEGPHSINFAGWLNGTISLTVGASLDVGADITINGPGNITVERPNAPALFRIFHVANGAQYVTDAKIKGLKLKKGSHVQFGGAIFNQANLHLESVEISDNTAVGF
jgi:hypothetical protein